MSDGHESLILTQLILILGCCIKATDVTQEQFSASDLLQSVCDTSLIEMAMVPAVRDAAGTIKEFTFVSVNRQPEQAMGHPDLVGQLRYRG